MQGVEPGTVGWVVSMLSTGLCTPKGFCSARMSVYYLTGSSNIIKPLSSSFLYPFKKTGQPWLLFIFLLLSTVQKISSELVWNSNLWSSSGGCWPLYPTRVPLLSVHPLLCVVDKSSQHQSYIFRTLRVKPGTPSEAFWGVSDPILESK